MLVASAIHAAHGAHAAAGNTLAALLLGEGLVLIVVLVASIAGRRNPG